MSKPTYRDLILVIILSIASLAFLTVPVLDLSPINIIPQLLIFLFLPGYALMVVIDPYFHHRPAFRRIFFSFAVSLLLTITSMQIPVEVSNYLILAILTLVLAILAFIRRKMSLGIPDKKKVAEANESRELKKEDGEPSERFKRGERTPPKERFYFDLILVIILTLLCALFILEPKLNETAVRTVLGLLLVLFLPGYALIASLFPRKDDLDTIERLALSFGLSIAITPLIGLFLNYTPYGIRLDPILVSLTSITLILCAVAYLRRRRIPGEDLFYVDFAGFYHGVRKDLEGEPKPGKILSVILILSIILAIATTTYIIVTPKEGENFTEFYLLGPGGMASDYPTNLTTTQVGSLIIGVINHEGDETSYRLVVTSNNTVQMEQTFTLNDGQKMEIPFNFTAGEPGERKMEFLLYKLPDNNKIYRSLHIWLNITGSTNNPIG